MFKLDICLFLFAVDCLGIGAPAMTLTLIGGGRWPCGYHVISTGNLKKTAQVIWRYIDRLIVFLQVKMASLTVTWAFFYILSVVISNRPAEIRDCPAGNLDYVAID